MEGLLANTDQLKGKMKEKVIANAELGRLSRKLAEIKVDCDVTFNADDYEICPPDGEKVQEIFEELEFRRLKDQFLKLYNEAAGGEGDKKEPKPEQTGNTAGSGQFSLFGGGEQGSATVMDTSKRKTIADVPHTYQSVAPGMAMTLFVKKLMAQRSVCFDTETTGLDPLEAQLVGIAFSWEATKGYYLPIPEAMEEAQAILEELRPFFTSDNIEKIGQNLKYDIKVLHKYDMPVQGPLFDTMLAHYLINPDMRHNMDVLAETYLNYTPVPITDS